MPRVRRPRNFSQFCEFDRGRIVDLRVAGKSFGEIGAIMQRSSYRMLVSMDRGRSTMKFQRQVVNKQHIVKPAIFDFYL
ncbi:hypothetical protein Zmor_002056 [Zophobas morio]|uniref:Uncharacterized protein n=1 Tax=Zophobas morio TaxID=2755281 RepID=A0AA38MTC6_9CUCU|nr:hypothetical protein Zmor_002056 [Zophobas morio]